ncbi:MAG: hypothetical protein EOO48_00330 [Flavobacterium sp.]|nr:MAG: hypothetical protein EOO48_00330 [Flavobacterium sp.]
MKAIRIFPYVFAACLATACGDSHNPKNASAGDSRATDAGGPEELDSYGTETDTSSIGGRTPAGSLTNQAPETNGSERPSAPESAKEGGK